MANIVDTIVALNRRLDVVDDNLQKIGVSNISLPFDICPCWVGSIEYNDDMSIKSIKIADFIRSGERDCLCKIERKKFRESESANSRRHN